MRVISSSSGMIRTPLTQPSSRGLLYFSRWRAVILKILEEKALGTRLHMMLTRLIPRAISRDKKKRDSGNKVGRITFGRPLSRRRRVLSLGVLSYQRASVWDHTNVWGSYCNLSRRAKRETVKPFRSYTGSFPLATSPREPARRLSSYRQPCEHARDLRAYMSCTILDQSVGYLQFYSLSPPIYPGLVVIGNFYNYFCMGLIFLCHQNRHVPLNFI